MILVTGATGTVGREVLKALADRGVPARALVRDLQKAGGLASPAVELVRGDFDQPESIVAACAGVVSAFLATSSSEKTERQQLAFTDAARRAGVGRVVKLSQFGADPASPGRFQRYHAAVESAIRASGLAFTFLRPNLFMQGLLNFRPTISSRGQFFAAAGDARVSVVDVRDIADAAVAALTEAAHDGRTYDLTGSEALTHAEMASRLSKAIGRRVEFVDVTPQAMRDALTGVGLPPWQADGLLEEYAMYREGEAAAVTSGVLDATGHAARSFDRFARDFSPAFAGGR